MREIYELSVENSGKAGTEKFYLVTFSDRILITYMNPNGKLDKFKTLEHNFNLSGGGEVNLRVLKEKESKEISKNIADLLKDFFLKEN